MVANLESGPFNLVPSVTRASSVFTGSPEIVIKEARADTGSENPTIADDSDRLRSGGARLNCEDCQVLPTRQPHIGGRRLLYAATGAAEQGATRVEDGPHHE
ncbi:hypothetical protein GCM10009547_31520 [Sporichthya brevicatena]|uniref:Uncharacterized protein n=1 Tax=Sporichthya brevicatena TaxID=171442 RepID=A0ABN1H110_9ACTN